MQREEKSNKRAWCKNRYREVGQVTDNFLVNDNFSEGGEEGAKGASGKEESMRAEDGRMLIEKDAASKRQAEHFEGLLNVEVDRQLEIYMQY